MFQESAFNVSIGISVFHDTIGVYVDNTLHDDTFSPPNDSIHVSHTKFTFLAAKRTPFGNIVTTLMRCGILPQMLIHQVNPDNKFYTKLPFDKLSSVISITRSVISGLTITLVDGKICSKFEEHNYPSSEIENKILELESQMNFSGIVVLGSDIRLEIDFSENNFSENSKGQLAEDVAGCIINHNREISKPRDNARGDSRINKQDEKSDGRWNLPRQTLRKKNFGDKVQARYNVRGVINK